MFFETSGWALPKSIATGKKEVVSNKSKLLKAAEPASKDGKVTHEADKIQAQLAALNDQPKQQEPEAPKAKKLRVRNKKRTLEQEDEEEAPKREELNQEEPKQNNKKGDKKQNNKKAKTDKPAEKQPETKKGQQKKKLQDLLKKKNTPAPKANNKPAEKKQPSKEVVPAAQAQKAVQKPIVDEDEGLTPLQRKMKEKLSGARFRWLNEQLYTTPGKHSYELFQEKPELFDQYHEGFRHQVESWPVNPVDVIIDQLKTLPKGTVIADLGCGDAMIAQKLTKQTVLSFDLIAKNDLVTACDITKVIFFYLILYTK